MAAEVAQNEPVVICYSRCRASTQARTDSMIITVTLNAAVDKTYTVANFSLDRVHRPSESRIVPGGKGINVSRVLKELGAETLAMGFAGGYNGGFIREGLAAEGIPANLVETAGESRVCITVIDPERGTQTEINENGPEIRQAEIEDLESRIFARLPEAEGLVMSGSIPPGVPPGIYARWIGAAHEQGKWALLDSSGRAMALGMEALPDIAKPNAREMAELTGRDLITTADTAEEARRYVSGGIGTMLVSMGRTGAMAVTKDEQWMASPPPIEFVSAVGSGDAFVAGFLFARHHGDELAECLRLATAAGAANAMTFGAGFCSRESIEALARQVEIRQATGEQTVS